MALPDKIKAKSLLYGAMGDDISFYIRAGRLSTRFEGGFRLCEVLVSFFPRKFNKRQI